MKKLKTSLAALICGLICCLTATAQIDSTEYPVGITNYNIVDSTIKQLQSYPLPRYKKNNTLLNNFNWIDPVYLGEYHQGTTTDAQSQVMSATVQRELARNWHYYYNVSWGAYQQWNDYWIIDANAHPEWKLGIITYRAQTASYLYYYYGLPNDHYCQTSTGQWLDKNGAIAPSKSTWRPSSPPQDWAGVGVTTHDGGNVRSKLLSSLAALNRTVSWLAEDGEAADWNFNAVSQDPACIASRALYNLPYLNVPPFTNYLFQPWLGMMFQKNDSAYKAQFWNLPKLSGCKYTEYGIDGSNRDKFLWQTARKVNDTINGQYYSTTDLYVRYPWNWRNWSGPWHGLKWVNVARYYEIALGDKLFSPYIAAGWDPDETKNCRPAQMLGLLKIMAAYGAEFYYSGYFNVVAGQYARGYVWQTVTAPYAQAITSYYEDILRNGTLMPGDTTDLTNWLDTSIPLYRFKTGSANKLVTIRKYNNKFAIVGVIENDNNIINSMPLTSTATFTLEGEVMTIPISRQGNTYIYDKSNLADKKFYQLDVWHEHTHPSRWSKDVIWEAEVMSSNSAGVSIKTEGISGSNYTATNSYIKFSATNDTVNYSVQIPQRSLAKRYFWIRARTTSATSTGIKVQIGATVRNIQCIIDNSWKWYRVDSALNTPIFFTLPFDSLLDVRLTAKNSAIEIDKFALLESAADVYGATITACTSVAATITPSGSTTFCQGGSVTLTANSAQSYLWNTAATTQSINVNTSGNYTVTVTIAGSTATSSPTTVTVLSLPTANVTPSGSTTFCAGGNVTLTATLNNSYLWSTGAVTQGISVSTAGDYTVTVTGANGCTKSSAAVTITVNSAPAAVITAGGSTTFCAGGSVTLTAPTATGNTYQWKKTNVNIAGATNRTYSATLSGDYVCEVTNAGCTATSNTITVLPVATPTTANAGTDQSVCTDSSSFTGNIPANGTGAWTLISGAGTITTAASATSAITSLGLGANVFRWTITNAPCSPSTDDVTITRTASSPVSVTIIASAINFCSGATILFTAIPINGGTPTFQWKKNGVNVGSNSANYSTAGVNGDQVECILTSSAVCASGSPATSNTITLSLASVVAAITAGGPTSFCSGGSVLLSATTGTGYTYQWRIDGVSQIGAIASTFSATVSGSFDVVVTNSTGCTATSNAVSVNATTSPTSTITPSGSTNICPNDSVLLTASTGTSYLWSNGNTNQSIYAKIAGNYVVTVTYGSGCSAVSAARGVSVKSGIIARVNPTSYTICDGDSVLLSANNASFYLWSTGDTTQTIYATVAGTYIITVTGSGGCTSSASSVVANINCTSECVAPPGSISTAYQVSARLDWQSIPSARNYIVELTNDQTGFVKSFTFKDSQCSIKSLNPLTQYHYTIQSVCGTTTISSRSIKFFFTTKQ